MLRKRNDKKSKTFLLNLDEEESATTQHKVRTSLYWAELAPRGQRVDINNKKINTKRHY